MRKNDIPEYISWKNMKSRCYSPSNKNTGYYFSNNITVCAKWLNDFDAFYADMGKKPSKKHSLDRINNNDIYKPENCRWATTQEQVENRGEFNKVFTHKGETHVLKEWARILNIKYTTLYLRIYRTGLSFKEAISDDPFNRLVDMNGEKLTVTQWCKKLGKSELTAFDRIHRGWDKKKAILEPINIKQEQNNE